MLKFTYWGNSDKVFQMATWIFFVLFACYIGRSSERCTSTLATTECDAVNFSRGHPLVLESYKNFLQFKNANIQEIPSGTFRLLPEVTTLYLSFNAIKKLEPGSFEGLTKLNQLILNHNSLEAIRNGVFRDCSNLKILDLGANKIKTIEKNAFSELINLEEIVLSFNQLENIPESVGVLLKVKKIDFSNNKIKSVTSNIFTKLNSLEVLSLESNKIQYIQDDAFKGLNKVKEINLKDNYLSNLNAANLINNLKSLKTIKLSINDFVCNTLRAIIEEFESRNIKVAQGVSKSNVTVNGMACKLQ